MIHNTFDDVASELADQMEESGKRLAPTLAFVDPFGFSGVPLETICRLTSSPKCEVFFNFMYDWANRFVGHPGDKVQAHMRDLFGTDQYRAALNNTPDERKRILHDLYREQLTEVGRFPHVLDFEMVDRRGKSYSLFFGTRHIKGLEAMKTAMWKIDPSGQFQFSDRHAGTTTLFDAKPDVRPLRQAIIDEFAGQEVTIETIHQFVLAETIYGPGHYRRAVLAAMERSDELVVTSSSRKKRNGYPPGTVLRFPVDAGP